jgi:hypothetical protein
MIDLSKYQKMLRDESSIDEIYDTAKASGLGGYALFQVLNLVCGLPFGDAIRKVKNDGYTVVKQIERSPEAPTANRAEFEKLFEVILEAAARIVENRLNISIPRNFKFEHGIGSEWNEDLPLTEVIERLYLGDDQFYSTVNLQITSFQNDTIHIKLWDIGRVPVPFNETTNTPLGAGPFRFVGIEEKEIDIVRQTLQEAL